MVRRRIRTPRERCGAVANSWPCQVPAGPSRSYCCSGLLERGRTDRREQGLGQLPRIGADRPHAHYRIARSRDRWIIGRARRRRADGNASRRGRRHRRSDGLWSPCARDPRTYHYAVAARGIPWWNGRGRNGHALVSPRCSRRLPARRRRDRCDLLGSVRRGRCVPHRPGAPTRSRVGARASSPPASPSGHPPARRSPPHWAHSLAVPVIVTAIGRIRIGEPRTEAVLFDTHTNPVRST